MRIVRDYQYVDEIDRGAVGGRAMTHLAFVAMEKGDNPDLVEFLTPAFGDETIRELPALGVNAQALNYLNFLIAEPIHAAATMISSS